MINNLPEYVKLNNAYNPAHYPANKKISAEEWNALWLSVVYQGNHQEDVLASILNITIPENINNINNLINITDSHTSLLAGAVATANEAKATADNAETVALGIDAKATEALANSETAVSTADEAKAIALSVEQAKVFDTFEDMETWLKDEANKGLHTTGLVFLIKDDNKSEYWVSEVLETPNESGYYYNIKQAESSVYSVNGQKGAIVLKTDDISDENETNKWSTAGEKEKVSKIVINGDGEKALLNDGTYGEVGTIDTVSINGGEPILPDENKNIDITITADDIPDTSTTNKFATAEELAQIETNAGDITDLQNNKADKNTTLTGYGITDAYTKTEIDNKIASVYKYKGSVANYASLPTDNLTIGDVYNSEDTGDNYAWTGSEWDKLAGTVDLSNYATKQLIPQWHVPYRDILGNGEPNTSKLATITSPLPNAILIRDAEGKATFVGGTTDSQGIVKSQLDNAIANMVTTNTDQTISGQKTFTNNIIGTLQGNAGSSTLCSRLKGVDTRDTNETPEWYYTGQSVNSRTFLSEFKTSSVLGLSGSTYCLLLTCVPWGDATGGLPSQTAYMSNGKKYARYATSTTTWSAWEKEATTQSYTATLSSSGWTGSSAPYSKEITVSGILATDKPDFDLNLSSSTYANIPTIQSAWFNVYKWVASANTITFYSHEIPSIDIPLSIKVVR